MSIAVFCPSRGRPTQARQLLESFEQTRSGAGLRMAPSGADGVAGGTRGAAGLGDPEHTTLTFLVDADDPTAAEYPQDHVVIGPAFGNPVEPSNAAALASDADIIGWTGDDTRFLTRAWDLDLRRALSREPGVYWGWDGHDKPWPSTFFVSREIVQALGWLILPGLARTYWDTVWCDLAAATSTGHVSTLTMFRHDNSASGGVSEEIKLADETRYQRWRAGDILADAKKIRSLIDIRHFFPPDLIYA